MVLLVEVHYEIPPCSLLMAMYYGCVSACNCDPGGSLDEGICDSYSDKSGELESGKCHCKANVEGRRCDTCRNGFWNFDENNPEGCQRKYGSANIMEYSTLPILTH